MAADVANPLCKPLFILNVFLGIILFAEMNLAEFEGLDEYSLSNITTQVNDRCVLVAVHPTKLNSGLGSILRKLSQAFMYESRVSIGVLKQTDVSLISWQNSKSLDLIERGDLAFFPRKMTDRTCLLRPSWKKPPTAQSCPGSKTAEELLAFLNTKCETFRQLDGRLSPGGIAREKILENLYRVPHSLDPRKDSNSGPVNVASTCERIPLPSKEEFFHEYFFRSKPVVITGRKKYMCLNSENCKLKAQHFLYIIQTPLQRVLWTSRASNNLVRILETLRHGATFL